MDGGESAVETVKSELQKMRSEMMERKQTEESVLSDTQKQLDRLRSQKSSMQQLLGKHKEENARKVHEIETLIEERRMLQQQKAICIKDKERLETELSETRHNLLRTMPQGNREAYVQCVLKTLDGDKVRGTVLDNLDVEPQFHVAVECIGGNSLFNVVVKDDAVAGNILTKVRNDKLGAIELIPLNKFSGKSAERKAVEKCIAGFAKQGIEVVDLVDVVNCEAWMKPVIEQVFGNTCICETLEICESVAHNYGVNAVTLDGDRVQASGIFQGGFIDKSRFQRLG